MPSLSLHSKGKFDDCCSVNMDSKWYPDRKHSKTPQCGIRAHYISGASHASASVGALGCDGTFPITLTTLNVNPRWWGILPVTDGEVPLEPLCLQSAQEFSLKMYTRFRNFLAFWGIPEALSAKTFATLATRLV